MSESPEGLRKELEERSSEELVSILRNRDEEEWRPEVFEIVASVLKGRGISPEEIVALGPEDAEVVDSGPSVTLATFFSPAEAHMSRMALEEAGIPAWIADESAGTMYGFGIGARVQVRAADEGAAREVLSAMAPAEPPAQEGEEP
jgi:hypothetical protein